MRLIFMGTPEFAVPSLVALADAGHDISAVITRPDRPRRRRSSSPEPSAIKREAERRGLPVLQPASIRDAAFDDRIRALDPEIIIVVAFGAILPPAILKIPPRGCVNVHASLLPRHRGAAPIARSIMLGDRRTGITTMQMDEGLDTGAILLQESCDIGIHETAGELTGRLATIGAELLVTTLARLQAGTVTPGSQDSSRATLAPPLRKEEGRFDWNGEAESIAFLIRGCNPWPTAVARLRGEPVQLLRAGVASERPEEGETAQPGVVVGIDRNRILVRCGGETFLEITELRFAGRKAMNVRDAVNGRLIKVGDTFAPATSG
jgi:methionyl-tRNA formyltransferase